MKGRMFFTMAVGLRPTPDIVALAANNRPLEDGEPPPKAAHCVAVAPPLRPLVGAGWVNSLGQPGKGSRGSKTLRAGSAGGSQASEKISPCCEKKYVGCIPSPTKPGPGAGSFLGGPFLRLLLPISDGRGTVPGNALWRMHGNGPKWSQMDPTMVLEEGGKNTQAVSMEGT